MRRMVLRSTPVRREISCCVAAALSSVSVAMRKCDFQTFNSFLRSDKEGPRVMSRRLSARRLPAITLVQVGEFGVATTAGIWVTARGLGALQRKPKLGSSGWWPRAESNHRHKDFQSSALPTELLGRALHSIDICNNTARHNFAGAPSA